MASSLACRWRVCRLCDAVERPRSGPPALPTVQQGVLGESGEGPCQGGALAGLPQHPPNRPPCFCPCPASICSQCSSQNERFKSFRLCIAQLKTLSQLSSPPLRTSGNPGNGRQGPLGSGPTNFSAVLPSACSYSCHIGLLGAPQT